MILSKCLPNGCGFWCWLHDHVTCRFKLLCYLADRTHYPDLTWKEYWS